LILPALLVQAVQMESTAQTAAASRNCYEEIWQQRQLLLHHPAHCQRC
jgi:hypothetical protein